MRRLSLLVASLFVLAAIAEDEWTENPSLSSVKAPHSPRIAQLAEPSADQTNVENTNLAEKRSDAEGASNKRARPSIGHLLGFDEDDCRSGDAGCKHAILSEATSEVMGGDVSWIVFKLPESGDFKAWLFAVLCVSIVVFSILFEHLLHWTRHKVMTKHGWKHVMGKVSPFGQLGSACCLQKLYLSLVISSKPGQHCSQSYVLLSPHLRHAS